MSESSLFPTRASRALATLVVLAAAFLGGCAGEPQRLALGSDQNQTLQKLGAPTGRYTLPQGGLRLQYSREPFGYEVNNVDLDASGRVTSVTQVMNENRFAGDIKTDVWTREDVLRQYGRPALDAEVASFNGSVLSWRYLWFNSPKFLNIYVDRQGVVRRWDTIDEWFNDMPQL